MNRTTLLFSTLLSASLATAAFAIGDGPILTPPPPASPRINGPIVFGVRPSSPFLYTIPATGDKPISFSIDNLPAGLALNPATGQITGTIKEAADGLTPRQYDLTLHAHNVRGDAAKKFRITVGDKISLTPALGWNSWNCWASAVDQDKVLRSANSMVNSGLKDHGWTYINIDDTWQAQRGGEFHALQANQKFPDMKKLTDQLHALGLKAGIYSTPWITSYAGFPGGSSNNPEGTWTKGTPNGHSNGKFRFASNDAKQFAAWGFDYLKYDWNPNDLDHVKEMSDALRASGRDIVYSLSNAAPFDEAADLGKFANSWRTTGDIWDRWDQHGELWNYAISEIAFSQDKWAPFAAPGHFNDPDMLVVGYVGWGPRLHLTTLTPDEQYTHITMWCMLSAPLLIGCDMDRLDPFTLNLLTNDEVLAIDQDALGKQAVRVATVGAIDIFSKPLEDGSTALAFANRANNEQSTLFNKLPRIGLPGKQHVRDLWRQIDLPDANNQIPLTIPAHGIVLYKFTSAK